MKKKFITIIVPACILVSAFLLFLYSQGYGKQEMSVSMGPIIKASSETGAGPVSPQNDSLRVPSPANDPPIVEKAKLQLETANNKDIIKVIAVGKNEKADTVTFEYAWYKNGNPAGNGDAISDFSRGDKLSVKITPFSGNNYGSPKILSVEISNTPPKIIQYKVIEFVSNSYVGEIKAADADGDPLTYALKSGPPGMTIDAATGLIRWNVPAAFIGKASFTVSVTDGHGGETVQILNANIKSG